MTDPSSTEISGNGDEQRMEAALKPFGWGVTGVFWQRYYSDPWVFNLANAVERLHRRVEQLEREVALREHQT